MVEPPTPPRNRGQDLSAIVGNELSATQQSEAANQQALQSMPAMEEPQGGEMELMPMEGMESGGMEMPSGEVSPPQGFAPADVPQEMGGSLPRETEEFIQEIAESIIGEKWEHVSEELGDLAGWQDRINTDVQSIKQEILRVESRLDQLQNSVVGRIGEYDSHISSVATDVRALEQVLQKMMKPLSTNIKELSRIAEDLKSNKKAKKK
jgi:tetrahydromethanopterin S-methyltransferase subunit B